MPNKPTRWGIKLWTLCESKTGFLLNYDIYTGKKNIPVGPGGLGYRVVHDLLHPLYLNIGHYVFTDSFYSSPELFQHLHDNGTGACGTVSSRRRGMPKESLNLNLKKGDPPVFFRKNDLLVCHWHDTAKVSLISTIDNNGTSTKNIRCRDNSTGYRNVSKPNVATTYNASMGGVDLFDQLCANLPFPHKCQKWYHAIYHFIKEAALVNSYILYKAVNVNTNISQARFRESVAEKLISFQPKKESNNCGRRSSTSESDNPPRLFERHFPMKFEDANYKPDCVVCSKSAINPKRKQTRFGCMQCHDSRGKNMPMCLPDCFTRFHSVLHY